VDERGFWAIIEASRPATRGDQEGQLAALREALSQLPPEKIAGFEIAFRTAHDRAFNWDLWAAAYVIRGGCGDDCFDYFRNWLISQGHDRYERTISDPDSLVEMALDPYDTSFEEIAYLADQVYEELTGSEIEWASADLGAHDEGEPWEETEEELRKRVPKLFAKYWDTASRTETSSEVPEKAKQFFGPWPPLVLPGFWGKRANLSLNALSPDHMPDLVRIVEEEEVVEFYMDLAGLVVETDLSFLEEFPTIRSVILRNSALKDISPLSRLPWLYHLELQSNCATALDFTGLEDLCWLAVEWRKGLESLFDVSWLRVLQLRDCPWRSSRQLGRLAGLKALELYWCGFRELTALAQLSELTGLRLCVARAFDRYEDLARIPSLRRLELDGMQVTERGLGDLVPIQGLTHLGLHGYNGDDGEDRSIPTLKPLLDLPNLEYVSLYNSEVTDRDLTPLLEHPNIEKVYFDPRPTEGYHPGGYDHFVDLGKMTEHVGVWIPPWGEG
jgi:hypothetical protein